MLVRRIWNRATAPFQLLFWQVTLPEAEGAKLLIECKGKFLMIREAYGPQHWTFPGGRMKRYETPENTARRKAKEEVGITLKNLQYLGSYFHTRQYKKDAICVYFARTTSFAHTVNTSNIVESAWYTLDEILQHTPRSESVEDALELYRRHTGI
jgi:ADP-ribose pyrophosphatase YjhB (NUDIX family)